MKKFFIKDCPTDLSIFNWLSSEVNLQEAICDVRTEFCTSDIIEVPHKIDIPTLINDTNSALDKFGIKGWQSHRGESNAYGGLSMVYNPDLINNVDPNQNTLGTKENKPDQFYYGSTDNFKSERNTYFDSYGFRKLSPCITESGLNKFIREFKLSPTRSRIAVLDANLYDRVGEEFLWHKDETIFENLRINIPIETDNSFMFQLDEKDPQHLEIGKMYTWDTHLPHRVYATKKIPMKRIHLVLGFTPWFDYLEEDDAFVQNDFFGKVHPFDIILKGFAHPQIGLS